MKTENFSFDLPDSCIALEPVAPRDAARLLIVRPDAETEFIDAQIPALIDLIDDGDCLVLNDTRVIPAALKGIRIRSDARAKISLNLIKEMPPNRWRALAKPTKRLQPGDKIRFGEVNLNGAMRPFDTRVLSVSQDGEVVLEFGLQGEWLKTAIDALGTMPLPPYIAGKRDPGPQDHTSYQTIYAKQDGAVAAPTAGLHFTNDTMAMLSAKGVMIEHVTLHVGAGTFLPVKSDDTNDHKMHAEWGSISQSTANAINTARARGGRIIAVGTTALRLIESAADDDGTIKPFAGETDIFITPGYQFKAVDVLMTNFHLPRSTLLMLVAAFSGLDTIKKAYAHAVAAGYRFYSYGDATLLFPAKSSLRNNQ